MRFIIPVILIAIAITLVFAFTNPLYGEISLLRGKVSSYNEALNNSKAFENERDKLTAKYNAISKDDLAKLEKFMPENVDNIRLILEIEKIALPYGMALKDVKYDTVSKDESAQLQEGVVQGGITAGSAQSTNKEYGVWNLEFSTTGTYNNFLNFTRDLESNLRIVDISSVSFSSGNGDTKVAPALETYKFSFKIKTYWLKN